MTDTPLSRPGHAVTAPRRKPQVLALAMAVAQIAIVAATYFLAARLGLRVEFEGTQASALWPPSGLALAAVLLFGPRALAGVVVGAFLANFVDLFGKASPGAAASAVALTAFAAAHVSEVVAAAVVGFGNALEALAASVIVRRYGTGMARLDNAPDVVIFVMAAVIAPLVASTVGVGALAAIDVIHKPVAAVAWFTWWLGDVTGILVVTPLVLAWAHLGSVSWRSVRWAEMLAALATLVAVAAAVFTHWFAGLTAHLPAAVQRFLGNEIPLGPYVVAPALLWIEFRLGPATGAFGRLLTAVIAAAGTLSGAGPFAAGTTNGSLLALQGFVSVVTVTMMLIAGALGERRQAIQELTWSREQLERRVERRTAALAESETRYRTLVEGVTDYAIYLLDPEGHVINWNAGAQRIKGYTAEEIIGQHFSIFYTPEDRAAQMPQRELDIAARDGKFEIEAWRVRKDGGRFYANIVLDALRDEAGRLVGFAKITRDITQQVRQKEALELARASLAQAQKMEAIGQLTGGIAHDFNNILTVIIGNVEIIQRGVGDTQAKLRDAAHAAMRGAMRAAAVTQRLLAFARRQPLDPRPVDVNVLVAEMNGLFDRVLGESVTREMRFAEVAPRCFCDANQLETALLNLVLNARDAMPEGGKVVVATSEEQLSPAPDEDDVKPGRYIVVRVSDNGIGMRPDVRARVFEPFFTTKEVGKGSGLGLSMVYGFVKQSQGHIRVESEPGKGTIVTLYLPREADRPIATAPTPASELVIEHRMGALVLVVEDNAEVRDLAVGALRGLGYRVISAADGEQALGLIAAEPGIELLFVDVGLPRFDGTSLAVEAMRRCPRLRVLFTTGHGAGPAPPDGLGDQAPVLRKPFTRDDLARAVGRALANPP
ncbi:MAG: MASE1 domain-containing protein [Alphaproteobacteria bacterium]|nr:MASE1 domain-containing protein [Alphaproteobacteria bacterium]